MFWADSIAKGIVDSKKHTPYWVDDMFTPSGFAHIGSLRGPLVHDVVYRTLTDSGVKVISTFVFNDFDPMDGLPPELVEKFTPYLGFPLRNAPSPDSGFKSFAEYFTKDFQQVLRSLGVSAKFLSSWDMYHEGKFNEVIRIALDHAEVIQDIYQRVSGSKKREKGWLPLQVICEKCGKLGTTRVHDWDGKTVAYTCEQSMVTWATGCGYTGRVSPFDGRGKLPWKVDWPAHWKVMGVTIEGAGKDHSSSGGSRDIARVLCEDVFHYPDPYTMPYEFFLIGGKKMSSSKGLGLKARDLTSLLPPSVGRFLFTRTDYRQTIEFDPIGTMAIPDLFDEYDRCWQAYIYDSDQNLARAFVLSQTAEIPAKQPLFIPRFREVANYVQLGRLEELAKGTELTKLELSLLEERAGFARVWLQQYAPDKYRMQMADSLPKALELTQKQKIYLTEVIALMELNLPEPELQTRLYNLTKEQKISPKDAFAGLYLTFIGKTYGPRAGAFLLQYPKEKVITRLKEAVEVQ